jgi:hypothetical protein
MGSYSWGPMAGSNPRPQLSRATIIPPYPIPLTERLMTPYRTDLLPFLLDLLDFMIEQIQLARSESDRVALVIAIGAIPIIRGRLPENKQAAAIFKAVFDSSITDDEFSVSDWDHIAKGQDKEFHEFADRLNQSCHIAKMRFQKIEPWQDIGHSEVG